MRRLHFVLLVPCLVACGHPASSSPGADALVSTPDGASDASDETDAASDASGLWFGWDPSSWDEPPDLGSVDADATTTGIPPGTGTLTTIAGDYTTTSDDQQIDRLDIHGRLIVANPGVTVKRSRIRKGIVHGGGYNATNGDRTLRVWACEIGRTTATDTAADRLSAVSVGFREIKRTNLFGFLDGIHPTYSASVDPATQTVVKDNFFHDLSWMADPNQTEGTSHNDHIQLDGQRNGNYLIQHNTFFTWSFDVHTASESCTASSGPHWYESTKSLRFEDGRETSGMLFNFNNGTNPIHDVVVDDNRIIGHADYYINIGQDARGISVTNNRFGEQFTTGKGYVSLNGNTTVTRSGNVHDANGSPISF